MALSTLVSAPAHFIDALLDPVERLPPLAGVAVIACLTAIGALLVIRITSNQARLAHVRRGLQAGLYEIWLFRRDVRAMWRAVGEVARLNVTYVRLSLMPALWMAVPSLLLVANMQTHYAHSGLVVGQPTLVKVQLSSPAETAGPPTPRLAAPAGLRVETPAVWIPSLRELVWRIVPERPGVYDLTIGIGDVTVSRTVAVAGAATRSSPLPDVGVVRVSSSPPIEAVSVTYPRAGILIFGHAVHWSVPFIALTAVFAWALRRRFGVTL
jgi:hypothetical protein